MALFATLIITKCSTNVNSQTLSIPSQKKYIDTLLIEGVNIWVRSEPKTGNVIMRLNNGNECYVLEKGEKQTIRGNTDYWYKIEYQKKEGWVFGSQTSIKQLKNENFEDFFHRFISDLKSAEYNEVNLQQYISPTQGVYFTGLDCYSSDQSIFVSNIKPYDLYYTRKSETSDLWSLIYSNYDLSELSGLKGEELKNRIEIKETNAILNMPMEIGTDEKRGLIIEFKLIEGKWYIYSVVDERCINKNAAGQKRLSLNDFIKAFIKEYFMGKDIDEMIANESSETFAFIHPDIGFARFFNPGVMCVPYDHKKYFSGKVQLTDNYVMHPNESPADGFCEESSSQDGVYYTFVKSLPVYYDITGEDIEKEIEWPYPEKYKESKKVVVNILENAWITKTMYFIEADGTWWLVIIDDCDCSA